ncbi:MAG: porin [Armatimonadetes bacterium]|nr:porin [Armatimonadota bacterium]
MASAQQLDWKLNGYLDGYYQYDFGQPASGDNVNGRGFDIAQNRFRLANIELDVAKLPTTKNPWGLTLQIYGGKNADLIHVAEPGGSDKYKFVRQAYVSFAPAGSTNSLQFDLGMFDTWIGYEGVDTRLQDQYGRSFNWTYSEPTYETGLRLTGRLSDKLSGGLYVVRGWNEVEDGNGSPSLGATLTYALDAKTTVTLQNHYGDEGSDRANDVGLSGGIGFSKAGLARVHLLDLIISHQLASNTKIALNIDHATAVGPANDGQWNGEVLYLKHQINQKESGGLRLERFEDKDGLRAGLPIQLYSITAGYDRAVTEHATLRLELRRDFASQDFFNSDQGLSQSRTTLAMAAVLKF